MPQPLISIVIANYNYGRFLSEAIESILNQSCQDVEIIVCDGGSTDNSVDIIKKYADKIAWWCSEKDKGQSDAFNKGFAHARGRFGTWLNADDILVPNALASIKDYVIRHPNAEWIAGSSVFANSDLQIQWCSRCVRTPMFFNKRFPWYGINGPSSFFLISNLLNAGGFDLSLRYTMDTDLWRRFVRMGIKLHHVKAYVWCFRVHGESKTSHVFIEGKRSAALAKEGAAMNARYGISYRDARIADWMNRTARLVSGTYLWSFIDTKINKGRRLAEMS